MSRKLTELFGGGIPLHEAAEYFIRVKTGSAPTPEVDNTPVEVTDDTNTVKAAQMEGMLPSQVAPAPDQPELPVTSSSVQPPAPMMEGLDPETAAYLQQEMEMAEAQEKNQAEFYKQKAQQASMQVQQMQEQISMLSQQTQQLQAQLDQSQSMIQTSMQQAQLAQTAAMSNAQQAQAAASQATSQALQSMEEVLRQKQLAAAMRMGAIQLKDQVMGALAQDPTEQLAGQLTSPPPGSAMGMGGMPGAPGMDPSMGGAPAQPGDPSAQPAEKPQGGGSEAKSESSETKKEKKDSSSDSGTKVTVSTSEKKEASGLGEMLQAAKQRLPYAVAGGVAGGMIGSSYAKAGNEGLKGKIQQLEQEEQAHGPSLGRAINLAQAKARLAFGEVAEKHPQAATIMGAITGATSAAAAGPEIVKGTKEVWNHSKHMHAAGQRAAGLGMKV